MKRQLLLILSFLLLQMQFVFSQCVSIELSIIWKTGYDIIRKDSIINIPILNVTYRNNCDTDYYFLNLDGSENNLPRIPCTILDNVPYEEYVQPNYIQSEKLYGKYANQKFSVQIGRNHYYTTGWRVFWISDFTDITSEYVNCYLSRIYAFISHDKNLDDHAKITHGGAYKLDFKQEDLVQDSLLNSVGERFVFLKSGETFNNTYNLLPFHIVNGCFTFFIHDNKIDNYVLSSEYDSELRKFVEIKHELPTLVGEYHLYSGAFNTNKVTVCFGEQSDDRNLEYLRCIQNQENQMDNVEKQDRKEKKKEKRKKKLMIK